MKKIFNNIKKHFIVYTCLIVVGFASCFYFLELKNMPRNEELISIFVGAKGNNNSLLTKFDEQKPDYIRKIQYRQFLVTDSGFNQNYKNFSYNLSDIIIIPRSKIFVDDVPICFAKLNTETISEFSSLFAFYDLSDEKYGFLIHQAQSNDNDYLDYGEGEEDEDYFAFIKRGSIHGGSLSGSKYRTALDFIKVFSI